MTLQPGEDIGLELHTSTDQFIRVEEGEGIVYMGDTEDNLDFVRDVKADFVFFIPAGKWHNLVNTGDEPLKLYSIYAPAEHPFGTVHATRVEGIEHDHDH
jgi:mannose-6-phosphate isomerase-like protein (cupin superfamily)